MLQTLYQRKSTCADSGNNHLPEPPKEKVIELISELQKFTTIYQKKNLRRLVA
jgi:hypothetical protein